MLLLSPPELRALLEGEVVTAFVARGTLTEGDEIELAAGADRPDEDIKPAYRRFIGEEAPRGTWTAVVTAVDPAALLDPVEGSARHVLETIPEGDLVVLRVYEGSRPVLSDTAFAARMRSIEGAMR